MMAAKYKKAEIDIVLLLIATAVVLVYFFGYDAIDYVCTHNILKGQF